MSPLLIVVGLPLVCGIVGAIYIWHAPKYIRTPMPELNWRTGRPRIEMDLEMEEQAA